MDVRAYLKAMRGSGLRLEALMERRRRCAEMERCGSGEPPQALEKLQREIDSRIRALAAQALEVERHIDGLEDGAQRDVLRYRYLNGWDWRSIAWRMHYSQDWVKHMHTRALDALEARMGATGHEKTHPAAYDRCSSLKAPRSARGGE